MNREVGGPGHPWAVGVGGVVFAAPVVRFNDFDLQSLWVEEYLWTLTVPPTWLATARQPPRCSFRQFIARGTRKAPLDCQPHGA